MFPHPPHLASRRSPPCVASPLVSALLAPALVLALGACSDSGAPGSAAISQAGLSADVHALAADSMRGRLIGTEEDAKAADWIRARFETLGLEPAGD